MKKYTEEAIRTGRPNPEEMTTGTIYPVEPEVAARLKAFWAAKMPPPQRRAVDIVGDLWRKQREREAKHRAQPRPPQIRVQEALFWHKTYYQAGESLEALQQRTGVRRQHIADRFRELGLPVTRSVAGRQIDIDQLEVGDGDDPAT